MSVYVFVFALQALIGLKSRLEGIETSRGFHDAVRPLFF